MKTKNKISFDKFLSISDQLDIRIGKIAEAEAIPKSYGIKLTVDFTYVGENGEILETTKTAFTNLGKTHKPEELIGIQCPFIMNLEPSLIKGVTSEVMIMVSDHHEFGLQVNPSDYTLGGQLM